MNLRFKDVIEFFFKFGKNIIFCNSLEKFTDQTDVMIY